MAKRQTLSLRFGVAGSGKTYSAVCDVIHEWAPYENGKLITNLPLYSDKIADRVAKDVGDKQGLKPDVARIKVLGRIHIIPEEVMRTWSAGTSGPWEYLDGVDIKGAHLIIDEFHNFGGIAHEPEHIAKWMNWFGELRHRGATCEIMSQDIGKVAKRVIDEAGMRVEISPLEEEVDPFLRIRLGDWFQVWARWVSGNYTGGAFEFQKRKDGRAWKGIKRTRWIYRKSVFELYNSFSKPHADQKETSGRPLMEWERLSRIGIVVWFVRRNVVQACIACLAVAGLMFAACGGISWSMKTFLTYGIALATKKKADPIPVTGKGSLVAGLASDDKDYKQYIEDVNNGPLLEEIVRLRKDLKQAEIVKTELLELNGGLYQSNQIIVNRLLWYTTLSAMEPDRVVTKSGVVWRLNEEISDGGPYHGQRLTSIDWERRMAQLSGGVVLRLPTVATPPAESKPGDGSDSKRGGSSPVTAANDSRAVSENNTRGGRLESTGPQPIPRRQDALGDSDLGATRRSEGNVIRRGTSGGNGPVGSSQTVRGPGFEGGPNSVFRGPTAGRSGNLVPTVDPRFSGGISGSPGQRR